MKRITFGFLAILLTSGSGAAAQATGIIAGYVRSYGTNVPVPNATVRLVATDDLVQTDMEGYFAFRAVPPGRHTVVVQALGYQPTMDHQADVLAATLTDLILVLRPTTFELAPIEVRGNVETNVTEAVSVITGLDIPPQGDIVMALATRVPGLTIAFPAGQSPSPAQTEGVTVRGRNGKPMMWVLDGTSYPGAISFYVDAAEVDCMEVRQGSPAVAEFARAGQRVTNFGGAIIIWTKNGTRRRFGACG